MTLACRLGLALGICVCVWGDLTPLAAALRYRTSEAFFPQVVHVGGQARAPAQSGYSGGGQDGAPKRIRGKRDPPSAESSAWGLRHRRVCGAYAANNSGEFD